MTLPAVLQATKEFGASMRRIRDRVCDAAAEAAETSEHVGNRRYFWLLWHPGGWMFFEGGDRFAPRFRGFGPGRVGVFDEPEDEGGGD